MSKPGQFPACRAVSVQVCVCCLQLCLPTTACLHSCAPTTLSLGLSLVGSPPPADQWQAGTAATHSTDAFQSHSVIQSGHRPPSPLYFLLVALSLVHSDPISHRRIVATADICHWKCLFSSPNTHRTQLFDRELKDYVDC